MRYQTDAVESLLSFVSVQTAIESRYDLEDDFGGYEDWFRCRGGVGDSD
jgi:hypothetical protein